LELTLPSRKRQEKIEGANKVVVLGVMEKGDMGLGKLQHEDTEIAVILRYLGEGTLPEDKREAVNVKVIV